jgi:hypothetical protein
MRLWGREGIETYDECMKKVSEKKMHREYRFVAHPIRESQTIRNIHYQLYAKIYDNIQKREAQGLD